MGAVGTLGDRSAGWLAMVWIVCVAPLPLDAPIGVYVHVPFCRHICPYCDFNTYAGQDALIPDYVDALAVDLQREAETIGWRSVDSIFFGGGTPSLLSADQVARIVTTVKAGFDLVPGAEVTLEANPNGLDVAYLSGLLAAGVNRLSIGLQTTSHRGLRVLGRMHEAEDAESAVESAVAAGYARISLDLIFGWPGQTQDSLREDVTRVLGWANGAVNHLSLYSLIVEPGTPMADAVARGILAVPDDDAAADLYENAMRLLAEAGWSHYEVANFGKTATDRSVHNRIYWRNGEYLGIGAGAHGRIGSERVMRHLLPATYVRAVRTGNTPISNVEQIERATAMGETMMLGLRLLDEGVSREAFQARHGLGIDEVYGEVLAKHHSVGLLQDDGDRITLTHPGLMLANDVCAEFV